MALAHKYPCIIGTRVRRTNVNVGHSGRFVPVGSVGTIIDYVTGTTRPYVEVKFDKPWNEGGQTRIAFWADEGALEFYEKPRSGFSSFVKKIERET